jgi:hypothetical protein
MLSVVRPYIGIIAIQTLQFIISKMILLMKQSKAGVCGVQGDEIVEEGKR